jgi:hypothetical protein
MQERPADRYAGRFQRQEEGTDDRLETAHDRTRLW